MHDGLGNPFNHVVLRQIIHIAGTSPLPSYDRTDASSAKKECKSSVRYGGLFDLSSSLHCLAEYGGSLPGIFALARANESSRHKLLIRSSSYIVIYDGTVVNTARYTYLLISAVKSDEFEALKRARKLRLVVEAMLTKSPSRIFRD